MLRQCDEFRGVNDIKDREGRRRKGGIRIGMEMGCCHPWEGLGRMEMDGEEERKRNAGKEDTNRRGDRRRVCEGKEDRKEKDG